MKWMTSCLLFLGIGLCPVILEAGGIGILTCPAYVNVKNFGATGDGATNDQAAIQAAINYAISTNGGTVIFPPGTYAIGSTLDLVLSSGVTLQGVSSTGSGSCILLFTMSNATTGIDARGSTGLFLNNIQIAYNSPSYSGTLIDFSASGSTTSSFATILNAQIYQSGSSNTAKTLLYLDGITGAYIQNTLFKGATNLVIGTDPLGSSYVSNYVSFERCSFQNWVNGGVYCPGTHYKFDTSQFVVGNTETPAIYNNSTINCLYLNLLNSIFNGCTALVSGMVKLYNTTGLSIYGCLFDGGSVANTSALYLYGSNYASSILASSFNNMTQGVVVDSLASWDGISLNNNYFGSGVSTPFSGYGSLGSDVNLDSNAPRNINFIGSAIWNPGSIVTGAITYKDISCTGVAVGDFVYVAPPYSIAGVTLTAQVISAGSVRVSLFNGTAATITLGSGTWNVRGFRW